MLNGELIGLSTLIVDILFSQFSQVIGICLNESDSSHLYLTMQYLPQKDYDLPRLDLLTLLFGKLTAASIVPPE